MKAKKKRAKSLRRQLAERLYKDKESDTFLSKVKSMKLAGYSDVTAKHDAGYKLSNTNFTDAEYAKIRPFLDHLTPITANLDKVLQQIADSDAISAKMYNNLLKHFEQISKIAGWSKQIIEKKVAVINVGIPPQICRKCGTIMDYLKE